MPSQRYEEAVRDPSSAFSAPEAVAEHHELTPEEKRTLLLRWREELEAKGERHEPGLLERIGNALMSLSGGTAFHGPGATSARYEPPPDEPSSR